MYSFLGSTMDKFQRKSLKSLDKNSMSVKMLSTSCLVESMNRSKCEKSLEQRIFAKQEYSIII